MGLWLRKVFALSRVLMVIEAIIMDKISRKQRRKQ